MEYLIGIDFGHGETTASYIDLNESNPKPKRLNILDGNTDEAKKVESCVTYSISEDKWSLDNTVSGDTILYSNFKAPMNEISAEDKLAFANFIKLVHDHIISNQSALFHVDEETGERNYEIYLACPSGWNKDNPNQIHEYLDFFKSIIPATWVIRESDAAYFKFKNDKRFQADSILVIDIGSSTIDFTSYNKERMLEPIGFKHGASRVEKDIDHYFEENSSIYKDAMNEVVETFHDKKEEQRWKACVVHFIKIEKEIFYTKELKNIALDYHNKRVFPGLTKRVFDNDVIERPFLEENILADYTNKLRNDLETIKESITPEIVILTGGASRMPWLQVLIKDVFTDSNVLRDTNPSYVVSDGIVKYAYAKYKYLEEFQGIVDEFWKNHTDENLSELIFTEFNKSLQTIQLPLIKNICDRFLNGDIKDDQGRRSTQAMIPEMEKHNATILGEKYEEIFSKVNESLNETLNNVLSNQIKLLFEECFGVHDIQFSLYPNLTIDLRESGIPNDFDEDMIKQITKYVYADMFNEGRIDKDRPEYNIRKKFIDHFYEIQEGTYVSLAKPMMDVQLAKLKECISEGFERLKQEAPFETFM